MVVIVSFTKMWYIYFLYLSYKSDLLLIYHINFLFSLDKIYLFDKLLS